MVRIPGPSSVEKRCTLKTIAFWSWSPEPDSVMCPSSGFVSEKKAINITHTKNRLKESEEKRETILDKRLPGLYHEVSEHCLSLRKGQRTLTRMNVPILLEWKNFLDILVISFILHRLFLLMRGTVAFQVSIGLVVLWLFQEVANAAGLVLTSWFFRGIGAVAVLVIVVVFRNELREILVHTNPIRFLLGRTRQTREVGYHLLAQAVFRLAKRRVGALVVIQNEDDLRGNVAGRSSAGWESAARGVGEHLFQGQSGTRWRCHHPGESN